MLKLIFLDTETTGLSDTDRLCQLAYKIDDTVVNEFFNPGLPIQTGAMAVHHITNEMVADKPKFQESVHFSRLKNLIDSGSIVVAHNAHFDISMLKREGLNVNKFIDTLKVSRYLDEAGEISSHALQFLRYHFKLSDTEATAHDALGDIIVLEQIFEKLIEVARDKAIAKNAKASVIPREQFVNRMVEISMGFVPLSRMPFGKYKGQLFSEIAKTDKSYLRWLLSTRESNETDEIARTIRAVLK